MISNLEGHLGMDDVVFQQRPELLGEVVVLNLHHRVLVQNIAPAANTMA